MINLKGLFKKPNIEPEFKEEISENPSSDIAYIKCDNCSANVDSELFIKNSYICHKCGSYQRMPARARINMIADKDSYCELFNELQARDIISFPNYLKKIEEGRKLSGENEAVICGTCEIKGNKTAIFSMESQFIMGSMGCVVGEKITRLFEYATENKLPVIGFTLSGGARMQEGIMSLMQMAKTSCAVARHNSAGLLYIVTLCDPTTGGVTASYAMEADIIIAEPNALIAFAGPKVIEQTIRHKLPTGFQRAEFLYEKGFIDKIVERTDLKQLLGNILLLHSGG